METGLAVNQSSKGQGGSIPSYSTMNKHQIQTAKPTAIRRLAKFMKIEVNGKSDKQLRASVLREMKQAQFDRQGGGGWYR